MSAVIIHFIIKAFRGIANINTFLAYCKRRIMETASGRPDRSINNGYNISSSPGIIDTSILKSKIKPKSKRRSKSTSKSLDSNKPSRSNVKRLSSQAIQNINIRAAPDSEYSRPDFFNRNKKITNIKRDTERSLSSPVDPKTPIRQSSTPIASHVQPSEIRSLKKSHRKNNEVKNATLIHKRSKSLSHESFKDAKVTMKTQKSSKMQPSVNSDEMKEKTSGKESDQSREGPHSNPPDKVREKVKSRRKVHCPKTEPNKFTDFGPSTHKNRKFPAGPKPYREMYKFLQNCKAQAQVSSTKPGSSVDPSTNLGSSIDSSTKPGSSVDPSTNVGSSIDSSTKPGSSVYPSTKPGSSVDLSTNLDSLIDSSTKPASSVDQSTHPGLSIDSSTNPGSSVDQFIKPVSSLDSSTIPGAPVDSSIKPALSEDLSIKPGSPVNSSTKPRPTINSSNKPNLLTDSSFKPGSTVDADSFEDDEEEDENDEMTSQSRALQLRHLADMEAIGKTVGAGHLTKVLQEKGYFEYSYSYEKCCRTTENNENMMAGLKKPMERLHHAVHKTVPKMIDFASY